MTAITRWRKGDKLSAKRLNETVDRITEISEGAATPADARGVAQGPGAIQHFEIKEVKGDYVLCFAITSAGTGTSQIPVAKPYLLRQALTSRNGITYTYQTAFEGSVAIVERVATKSPDTETQRVVPQYVKGDRIFASKLINGGTGVKDIDNKPVRFIDLNLDGRAWAKKA
ncbi:MAG: hypothetical protein ACREA0_12350 [bacterium]